MLKNETGHDLLTAGEAAKFLNIDPNRLRYLRNQGRVKSSLRIGNETYYTLDDLRSADIRVLKRGRKTHAAKLLDKI